MVYLSKVWRLGASLCFQVPMAMRKQIGLVHGDVVGFRVLSVQGKILIVGEKIPLEKLAKLDKVPLEVLPVGLTER